MARELADDALKQLDAALQVMPSPEAVAKVRERVQQEEDASRASFGGWWVAVAGAALVGVAIASAVFLVSRRVPTSPVPVVATNTPTPGDAVRPGVVNAATRVSRRDGVKAKPVPIAHAAVVPELDRTGEPEVLVPPDEAIALRKLLIAMREGRASVPSAAQVAEDAKGRLLEPAPIDIPSIKIELLPGTPVAGSGGIVK